jgi:hypothetical protein
LIIQNVKKGEKTMTENLSLSDIAAVTGNENGFGGNGGWFGMIILFALIFGWGGGGFGANRGGEQPVTQAGLCNAMNFNNLENTVGRLSDQQQFNYQGLQNGLCNIGYENLQNSNALQRQISDCCCTTQRAIDSVNYNAAMNTASINATTTEQTQKILDALCTNRMADMQNQINQLQLQSALSGVVRYPNGFTYTAGTNPFCGSCGCGNI